MRRMGGKKTQAERRKCHGGAQCSSVPQVRKDGLIRKQRIVGVRNGVAEPMSPEASERGYPATPGAHVEGGRAVKKNNKNILIEKV